MTDLPADSKSAHYAYVLPADATKPGRIVGWDRQSELLGLMYREIGTDTVDCGPLCGTPDGQMTIWVSDTGLVTAQPEYNDHAISIARAAGWNVPALAGTAFITGGPNVAGDTLGLSQGLLERIQLIVRTARPQIDRQAVLDALGAHIAAHGAAPTLGELAAAVGLDKAQVIYHLIALETAGRIRRDPTVPGVIRLVDEAVTRS